MGSLSLPHMLLLLLAVIVLFGAGRIPRLADDLAKGIKAFRNGMRDDDHPEEKKILTEDDKPKV